MHLSDFRGKAVLLNFWATWCPPCKVEIPWFIDLQKQYGPQGFVVLGVAMDDAGRDTILKFDNDMNINYPVLQGTETVGDAYGGVESLPTSFYIDREGKIVSRVLGLRSHGEVEANIQRALERRPTARHAEFTSRARASGGEPLMKNLSRVLIFLLCASNFFAADGNAASFNFAKAPSVTAAPVAPVAVVPGNSGKVELAFRVQPGFHINSNKPKSNLLIPTVLLFSPPTDVLVGKITYPKGRDLTFEFLPNETLNVYSGDFAVTALVSTVRSISLGTYRVHGALKYQACDNRQCYEPREVPLSFDVIVRKGTRKRVQHNPAQSPDVHY